MKKTEKLFTNTYSLFALNVIIFWVALFIEFQFIFTDNFYYSNFSALKDINNYIDSDRALEWINYIYALAYVFALSLFVAFSLFIGFNLFFKQADFKKCFRKY